MKVMPTTWFFFMFFICWSYEDVEIHRCNYQHPENEKTKGCTLGNTETVV